MRGDWRVAWDGRSIVLGVLLLSLSFTGPVLAESPPIRMTVELAWRPADDEVGRAHNEESPGAMLEVSSGTVLDAVTWDETRELSQDRPVRRLDRLSNGNLSLGSGPRGRVRVRIEAPIESTITIVTPAEGSWTLPLLGLLEGPQRTVLKSGLLFEAHRLDWDGLEVRLPGDGIMAPGAIVPADVRVNVLTPEPTEVSLLLSARLRPVRSDRTLWEESRRLVLSTNQSQPAPNLFNIAMPLDEGTYVLELNASWVPRELQVDGSRLSRWWRRLRNQSTDASVRRVSLCVVSASPDPSQSHKLEPPRRQGSDHLDLIVDTTDLGRGKGLRPRAEGRVSSSTTRMDDPWIVPEELLVDPPRRERFWNLVGRVGAENQALKPAGPDGVSWVAMPLNVPHPDRPHRLDLAVLGGDPAAVSVAIVAPGNRPRLLLDARGYGPPTVGPGMKTLLSWSIWPDTSDPVLIVVNRSVEHPLWIGEVHLVEFAEGPAPLRVTEPPADGGRSLAVRLTGPRDLERFGGSNDQGPDDPHARAEHLVSYLKSVGASAVVLPAPRVGAWVRGALDGQAIEDAVGPDPDLTLLSMLKRHRMRVLLEMDVEGRPLPGLPPPDDPRAEELGLVRLERSGTSESDHPTYNLLRPEVQRALTQWLIETVRASARGQRPVCDGVLLHLGQGPTLPGRPDSGFDDQTYARFVRDAIKGDVAPGLDKDDPERFAARHQYLTGSALVPWLTWRSRQVGAYYSSLAAALAEASPGVSLMLVTPGLDDGLMGAEARRFDRDGLPPDAAWRSLGLDLADWPQGGRPAPYLLRGVGTELGGLEHDLATHPALDAQLMNRPGRGFLLGPDQQGDGRGDVEGAPWASLRLSAVSQPSGPEGDEVFAHAVAALDVGWVVVSASTLIGQEDRFRRFATVFRSLPRPRTGPVGSSSVGTVARLVTLGDRSYLCLANDTPYVARVTAVIGVPPTTLIEDLERGIPMPVDLVSGGRRLSTDLPPFGIKAFRIGGTGVRLESVVAVHDSKRDAHRSAVARRLQSLASGGSISHLNPGFEPESLVRQASSGEQKDQELVGWTTEGVAGASLAIDVIQPRTGQGSLRLKTSEAPATATSPAFLPPGPAATLRAFVRTDPPDAEVRVRIESEPEASSPVHLAADLPRQDRSEWTPLALRAPGLPADGESRLRLRFELRSPGRLWIDDLSLTGPGLAQARSCLTAALQAYDEGRYADFARLARSHWVQEAGGPIDPIEAAPIVAPLAGDVSTDLPARSRLR
ncbi:hypothetical protein [Tautonia marina]|uniref:hypothetical protein n=1 Tax=Tautonia marina TaxID=2653855 RepID=UPI0012607BF8|nr:hypothetical protein [Tautonia marina]